VPDLLAVSISTVDYAGHAFGPDSWEYADALVRIDRQLGAWRDRLERRTSVAVLITSNHGVTPLPERSSARAGRIDLAALKQDLEAAVAASTTAVKGCPAQAMSARFERPLSP
jgi:predicted AlkP superfamily pyrophosphatase or phosphodiesterase